VDIVEGGEDVDVEVESAFGTENRDKTGGGGGRGNSKISTIFEYPLLLLFSPPPKNTMF
jgi:hypothetical protein